MILPSEKQQRPIMNKSAEKTIAQTIVHKAYTESYATLQECDHINIEDKHGEASHYVNSNPVSYNHLFQMLRRQMAILTYHGGFESSRETFLTPVIWSFLIFMC